MTDPGKNNTKDESSTTEMVLVPVQPTLTPELAARWWRVFLEMKKELLDENDYQLIAGKRFITKSGFRKLSVVFNLSDEIVEHEKIVREDETFYWRIVTMVMAPNGRTSVGVAICDSRERKFAHPEHDVYATCHTRAKNRAISDMVAGGIVSAEEMLSTPQEEVPRAQEKNAFKKIILKKPWTWDKIFAEFPGEIQTRQQELGKLWTFESAAIVVAREKGLVRKGKRS